MRSSFLTVLLLTSAWILAGQESGQRTASGVIVITGSTSQPAPEKAEGEAGVAEAPAEGAAEAEPKRETAAKPAPKTPETRSSQQYTYDAQGNRVPVRTSETARTTPSSSQRSLTLRNISGREVPYLTEREQVVSEGPQQTVVERRVDRYDTEGNPVSQQLVREERRTLPDGTIQTTVTTYESDVNGHMRPVERTLSEEKKMGATTRKVTTAERPDVDGGFKPYQREESVETKQGETSSTLEVVRKMANETGQLIESEREQSVMSKSGNTATTETRVWKRSVMNPSVIDLHSRTVGKLVEKPDGSSSETVQVYGTSREGGPTDVNSAGPALQKVIQRETTMGPNGETIENTTARSRTVADPSRMGAKEVVRRVARPTADGEIIETQVYEEGVNGRMQPVRSSVERVERQDSTQ